MTCGCIAERWRRRPLSCCLLIGCLSVRNESLSQTLTVKGWKAVQRRLDMIKKTVFTLGGLLILLTVCSPTFSSEEYVLVLEGLPVRLTSQPDAGYVIRMAEGRRQKANVRRLKAAYANYELGTLPDNARPLGGSEQRGIYVIQDPLPVSEKKPILKQLADQVSPTYMAPLFSCNDASQNRVRPKLSTYCLPTSSVY